MVTGWRKHRFHGTNQKAGGGGGGFPAGVHQLFLLLPFLRTLRLQFVFKAGLPYSVKVLKVMLKYVSPRWLIQNPVDNEDKPKQGLLLIVWHKPNYLPKAPSPNASTPRLGFQNRNLKKQSSVHGNMHIPNFLSLLIDSLHLVVLNFYHKLPAKCKPSHPWELQWQVISSQA